jgi:hypothetical protein
VDQWNQNVHENSQNCNRVDEKSQNCNLVSCENRVDRNSQSCHTVENCAENQNDDLLPPTNLIRVKINGRHFSNAVLDSGSMISAISQELADRLKIP